MSPRVLRSICLCLRLGLAGVFLYAGAMKLSSDGRVFAADISRLQLAPFAWSEHLAAMLPVAELLLGGWLLLGWRLRTAAMAAVLLGGLFAFAVAQAMARGLDFNCHCFGVVEASPPLALVLIRALLMALAAAVLSRLASRPEKNGFQ